MHATGLTVALDEELELLLRRCSKAKTGEGQVVLLSGEPGIGKSRRRRSELRQTARIRIAAAPQPLPADRGCI
jgi:predicted ATPase